MTQDGLMLIVHVHAKVKPELLDEFLTATLANAQKSLDEPGVLRFDVIQDQADPAHVVLVEVYRNEDAAGEHKLSPHYATWRDAVAEMMAEPRASVRYTAAFPAAEESWVSG
jgi:(4S)-4-hydroxy-5-phosphonooxypentane-2,3-dione isomerase